MEPIIVQQTFNHPKERVWKAITQKNEMVQWFFTNIPNFKAEVGFTTRFNIEAPSRDFLHIWKVTEVIPLKKLVVQWSYQDIEGTSSATFELSEQSSSNTILTVTCKGLENLPNDIPEFSRESCLGGWTYFINGNLREYLK